MSDPTLALHVAIIAALDAAVDCDVWDAVPEGASYPYVTVDTHEAANRDFLASRLDERFVYLNIWSQVSGQAEVLRIIGDIDALNGTKLTLSTGRAFGLQVLRRRTSRDADNLTYQGQVTLRMFTTR